MEFFQIMVYPNPPVSIEFTVIEYNNRAKLQPITIVFNISVVEN